MKRKLWFMAFCFCLMFCVSAQAQSSKEDAVKALKAKALKSARKEAKTYKKDGWKVTPGALPLEKQLERSYVMQYEFVDDVYPKYIMAEAMSVGGTFDSAKLQAQELAREQIAGQIQTELVAMIENAVVNEQLSRDEVVSITRTVMASKSSISQSLGRVLPVIETYREMSDGKREVLVRIALKYDTALDVAKKAVVSELEKNGGTIHKKLEELTIYSLRRQF